MRHCSFVVAVLGVAFAAPASAQVLGLPVVNNGAPTGLNVGLDLGFPNAAWGSGNALGARVAYGIGFIGASASVSHYAPSDSTGIGDVWSEGGAVTLRLVGGPLVPFRITLQGGLGFWSYGGADFTHIPVSLGLAATIPNPAFAIKPWVAPRFDMTHASGEMNYSHTDTHFGISGGVDLALLNGMSFRAAYDRVSAGAPAGTPNPAIFSVGLGFSH